MTHTAFLSLLAILVCGMFWLSRGYKKTGAAIIGLCIFLFLAVMPWRTVDLLIVENRHFRRWVVPRMESLRAGWLLASAAFSLAVGFGIALLKRADGRKDEWETPREFSGMAAALNAALAKGADEKSTFLGVANGGKRVCVGPVQRESHMQIVGPTRSGKSQLLFAISGQDMSKGMPVLLMEAKGDRSDFDQFLKLAGKAGRVDSVRYFNPQDYRSMTFNPIRRVPGQDATAIANQIARAIGREPTSSGEGQDYYRSVDYAKIQGMAEIFCQINRQFTLRDCFYYFAFPKARERAFDLCTNRNLVGIAAAGFKQSPETAALTSAIHPWTAGNLGDLLNSYSPQIKLEEIFELSHAARS